jgi:hypothetical protein
MVGLLENLRIFVSDHNCGAFLRLQNVGLARLEFRSLIMV